MSDDRRSESRGDDRRVNADERRIQKTPEAIERSDAFDRRLSDIDVPHELHELQQSAKRSARRDALLLVSIVLDVILSIVVWRVAVGAVDASKEARSAREQTIVLCRAGNESRAEQVQLWQFVIQLSANSSTQRPRTPAEQAEQQQRLDVFQQYLRTVFAQRDCSHLTLAQQPGATTTTTRPTTTTGGAHVRVQGG